MTFESEKFTGEGGWDFETVDTGTRLTYWFRGDPKKAVFKLVLPLMRPMIHRSIRKDYTRLKELLEAEA